MVTKSYHIYIFNTQINFVLNFVKYTLPFIKRCLQNFLVLVLCQTSLMPYGNIYIYIYIKIKDQKLFEVI